MLERDVTLYYDGGTGGVMFMLNFLKCTQNSHRAGWENGYTLDEVISKTWNVDEAHLWKDSEIAADGMQEFVPPGFRKLARYCNYSEFQEPIGPLTIMLYTDAPTHVELARMKKPNWFYFNYYNLRDPKILQAVSDEHTSPLHTFKDFEDLNDAQLKLDLVARAYHKIDPDRLLETDEQMEELKKDRTVFVPWNGMQISWASRQLIDRVDYRFRLQDVIKSRFECVTHALGIEHNLEVVNDIRDWIAMHPRHIRLLLNG